MALIPCTACQRHVFTTETICPFCQHELGPLDTTGGRRAPAARMSRAALVLLGVSSVACAGDTERSSDETAANSSSPDGGTNTNGNSTTVTTTAVTTTAVTNSGTVTNASTTWAAQAAYGAPPMGGFGLVTTTNGTNSGTGGAATGGTGTGGMSAGGTGEVAGGAAGEAGDVGGAGGNTPLPSTDGGGPIYGAPPTPW